MLAGARTFTWKHGLSTHPLGPLSGAYTLNLSPLWVLNNRPIVSLVGSWPLTARARPFKPIHSLSHSDRFLIPSRASAIYYALPYENSIRAPKARLQRAHTHSKGIFGPLVKLSHLYSPLMKWSAAASKVRRHRAQSCRARAPARAHAAPVFARRAITPSHPKPTVRWEATFSPVQSTSSPQPALCTWLWAAVRSRGERRAHDRCSEHLTSAVHYQLRGECSMACLPVHPYSRRARILYRACAGRARSALMKDAYRQPGNIPASSAVRARVLWVLHRSRA